MGDYIIEMKHIVKEFSRVRVLNDINFKVKRGEIHALCGENGAGKSTLIKILSGFYGYGSYQGEIKIDGKPVIITGIHDSRALGISVIYQELALAREMTVAENIFLGRMPNKAGVIQEHKMYRDAADILNRLQVDIDFKDTIRSLGIGQQQMVEIAKALSLNTRILILDEPSAALTDTEINRLMRILKDLKEQGVTCIYISHRLEEIFRIADAVTVLRDGMLIGTYPVSEVDKNKIISMMVGREMKELYPRVQHKAKDVSFEVRNWTVIRPKLPRPVVDNVSFKAYRGEILGIVGLIGAGRSELINSIFGVDMGRHSGELFIDGKPVKISSPRQAIENGIGLVSEDRKRYGLMLKQSVLDNITITCLNKLSKFCIINTNKQLKATNEQIQNLKIKVPGVRSKVNSLSGGNQQKIVIAKWLLSSPKILFLDEPTRGIDVGAKFEIYNIMNELVEAGVTIIMVSSELQEVLGICDRLLVMSEGKLTGEIHYKEATEERIMHYATGGK